MNQFVATVASRPLSLSSQSLVSAPATARPSSLSTAPIAAPETCWTSRFLTVLLRALAAPTV
jgi:hypothetical protein